MASSSLVSRNLTRSLGVVFFTCLGVRWLHGLIASFRLGDFLASLSSNTLLPPPPCFWCAVLCSLPSFLVRTVPTAVPLRSLFFPFPFVLKSCHNFIFYLFIFREREREGEKHPCVVASHAPPTGDLAHNPGLCPDWESNRQPFGSQAGTQSTEPQQPGSSSPLFLFAACHPIHCIFSVRWCFLSTSSVWVFNTFSFSLAS